jgi:uncharacterized membrane protein YfcA
MSIKRKIVIFILAAVVAGARAGYAGSPWAEEKTYREKVASKLQFALTNVMLGWTEIIAEPEKAAENHTNMFAAVGKGFVYFVADTLGGVVHLATFPIPQVDLPLPDNGVLA